MALKTGLQETGLHGSEKCNLNKMIRPGDFIQAFLLLGMKNFTIEVEISGVSEKLLVVPQKSEGRKNYRLIKDGLEFCTLGQNGELGWEVKGYALNAEELNDIGMQISMNA